MVIITTVASDAVVTPRLFAATVGAAILSTVIFAYTIPTIQTTATNNAKASSEFDQIEQKDLSDWDYPNDWDFPTNDETSSNSDLTLSGIMDYIYDRTTNAIADGAKNLFPNDGVAGETLALSEFMPKLSLNDFLDYMTERAEAAARQDGSAEDGMDGQTGDGNGDGGGADGGGGDWGDGNPPLPRTPRRTTSRLTRTPRHLTNHLARTTRRLTNRRILMTSHLTNRPGNPATNNRRGTLRLHLLPTRTRASNPSC